MSRYLPQVATKKRALFEIAPRFEAMLIERAESKTRFEMSYCYNDKRAAERYAELKRKAEVKR